MATRVRSALKTWMLVYLAFTAALLSATANGLQETPELLHVPVPEAAGAITDRRFFEARGSQVARIDF